MVYGPNLILGAYTCTSTNWRSQEYLGESHYIGKMSIFLKFDQQFYDHWSQ